MRRTGTRASEKSPLKALPSREGSSLRRSHHFVDRASAAFQTLTNSWSQTSKGGKHNGSFVQAAAFVFLTAVHNWKLGTLALVLQAIQGQAWMRPAYARLLGVVEVQNGDVCICIYTSLARALGLGHVDSLVVRRS